jgi:hypothetical protein
VAKAGTAGLTSASAGLTSAGLTSASAATASVTAAFSAAARVAADSSATARPAGPFHGAAAGTAARTRRLATESPVARKLTPGGTPGGDQHDRESEDRR